MKTGGVGIDLTEVDRFERFVNDRGAHFLKNNFSEEEISFS